MHAGNIRTLCYWFEDIEPTCIRDESGWFSNHYPCLSENDNSIWAKGKLNADVSLALIFLEITKGAFVAQTWVELVGKYYRRRVFEGVDTNNKVRNVSSHE